MKEWQEGKEREEWKELWYIYLMMRQLFGIFLCSALLASCGGDASKTLMETGSTVDAAPKTFSMVRNVRGGVYTRKEVSDVPKGRLLLLFGLSDDPFTKMTDRMLRTLYASGSIAITNSTYYIDYTQAQALRLRHAVVTYDTLVLLDEDGQAIKSIVHPSQAEALKLLR